MSSTDVSSKSGKKNTPIKTKKTKMKVDPEATGKEDATDNTNIKKKGKEEGKSKRKEKNERKRQEKKLEGTSKKHKSDIVGREKPKKTKVVPPSETKNKKPTEDLKVNQSSNPRKRLSKPVLSYSDPFLRKPYQHEDSNGIVEERKKVAKSKKKSERSKAIVLSDSPKPVKKTPKKKKQSKTTRKSDRSGKFKQNQIEEHETLGDPIVETTPHFEHEKPGDPIVETDPPVENEISLPIVHKSDATGTENPGNQDMKVEKEKDSPIEEPKTPEKSSEPLSTLTTPIDFLSRFDTKNDKFKRHSIVVMQGNSELTSKTSYDVLTNKRRGQPGVKVAELAHKFEPSKMLKRPSSSNIQISLAESPSFKSVSTPKQTPENNMPGSPFIYKLEEENYSLKVELDEKNRMLGDKESQLAEKDTHIQTLESRIIEKDETISSLEAQVEEKNSQCTEMEVKLALLNKRVLELEHSITSLVSEKSIRERSKSESMRAIVPAPVEKKKETIKPSKSNIDIMMSSMLQDLSTHTQRGYTLQSPKDEQDRRTRIALEILETEQSYVSGLKILINNWKLPFEEISKIDSKISESDIQKIFGDGSLESVYMLNQKLCESLELRLSQWSENDHLGDIFDEWAPRMAPYRRYSSKYGESSSFIQQLTESNPRFKRMLAFFDEHSMNFNGLRLTDYLVTPVQRIPRYTLLLRDLLASTPDSHNDYANLVSAIDKISLTATTINETIRQAESQIRMAAITERGGGFENLVRGNQYRRHIYDSLVESIVDLTEKRRPNKKQSELLLFNDILVASPFVSKKAALSDYSIPVPLLWIIHEEKLLMSQYYSQYLEPLDINPEVAIILKSPEVLWLVAFNNALEKKYWVEKLATTIDVPVEELSQGVRKGKYEFSHQSKGIYEGEWHDGEFSGKGVYVRHDGTLFDGYWDLRFKAGFGVVTSGTQSVVGWINNKPSGDVEVYTEHQLWGNTELNERDWSLLLTGAKDMIYKKNQPIIEQDIENSNLYRIKIGRCRVEKNSGNGRKVLSVMGPSSVFGDTSVLTSMKVATASVVSDAETFLQVIEVTILFEVLKTNPVLAMKFFRQMAIKLAQRLKNLHTAPDRRGKKKRASTLLLENESNMRSLADREYQTKFGLPDDEVTIKSSSCILRGVMKKYGTIYVSQRYLCFESYVFGILAKEVILLSHVQKIEVTKKRDLKIGLKNKKLYFQLENIDEFHSLITSLCANSSDFKEEPEYADPKVLKARKSLKKVFGSSSHEDEDIGDGMTRTDWNIVQQGFKSIIYSRDEALITQGTINSRIYQLAKGRCRIEIAKGAETQVIGYVEEGALLGEMSFLEESAATASVIADEDIVVYVLEGYFINSLFVKYPDLSGRFYCHLCSVIASRLREREDAGVEEDKEKRIVKRSKSEKKEISVA